MVQLYDDYFAILLNDEYDGAGIELTDNLGIVLYCRSGKTCKSRHGRSSLEQNNGKELGGGGWNQPRDEEPSGVEWRERISGSPY